MLALALCLLVIGGSRCNLFPIDLTDGGIDSGADSGADSGVDSGYTPPCGDHVVQPGQACDDGNTASGDGCSSACEVEPGWTCAPNGTVCYAARCGDGFVAGVEECDDGDTGGGDGCDAICRLEDGFKCPTPGQACVPTTCGDGVPEGTEQCDDANHDMGDGCSPLCEREPSCANGVCTPYCGDGVLLPNDTTEQCDDGNPRAGDGCSPTCHIETGWSCERVTQNPPAFIEIPVVYRDFRGWDLDGGHIDFQNGNGTEKGIVDAGLGADGKPVYAKEGMSSTTTHGAAAFNQWYRDAPGMNRTVVQKMILDGDGGSYVFDDQTFFPLDDAGWVATGEEPLRLDGASQLRNFSFTSEARYWFEYKGAGVLTFRGDDDVWVFINEKRALDLGGVHSAQNGSVDLAANAPQLGLADGGIYEIVVFQAERHTTASSYRLTLNNFDAARSVCTRSCGDLGLSCSLTQGCCSGLICTDAVGYACDGTTPCTCTPPYGLRAPSGAGARE